eukprot:scaffold71222_cov18-Prasinocladus_malaysianus.AAC.1
MHITSRSSPELMLETFTCKWKLSVNFPQMLWHKLLHPLLNLLATQTSHSDRLVSSRAVNDAALKHMPWLLSL